MREDVLPSASTGPAAAAATVSSCSVLSACMVSGPAASSGHSAVGGAPCGGGGSVQSPLRRAYPPVSVTDRQSSLSKLKRRSLSKEALRWRTSM